MKAKFQRRDCFLPASWVVLLFLLTGCATMRPVQISSDGGHFTLAGSGRPFVPWGNNYGNHGRLIEDFWATDWPVVEKDFQKMHAMGANVVRVHLQLKQFLLSADRPNIENLRRLQKLLKLAEENHLYLDLTGLASYRKMDAPAWYDALDEKRRWAAQGTFWEYIALACHRSPAVFCYDLMNEPISPGSHQESYYTGGLGGLDFCQFIALDPGTRRREDLAREWVRLMRTAIRRQDREHLITVGMLPWDAKWHFLSGFVPDELKGDLDFISVHIYPQTGKVNEAMDVLKNFAVGKPVVIEETFPLYCGIPDERQFLLESRSLAAGWIGHYDGASITDLRAQKQEGKLTVHDAMYLAWLELFEQLDFSGLKIRN